MANEMFNLRWNTYNDHLRQMVEELKNDEGSQDVTLVCDDKTKIKAHQIVLKACSPVFAAMLEGTTQPNSIIYLRGIGHQEMDSILQFMYLGETTFYQERMNELLNLAKNLEVKDLSQKAILHEIDIKERSASIEDYSSAYNELFLNESKRNSIDDPLAVSDDAKVPILLREPDPQAQCPDCNKQFPTKKNMITHNNSIHQGLKFSCNQCDYKSYQKNNLTNHVKSKHEGVRYCCNQCNQKFVSSISLSRHRESKH
mgnify:CR=1 FL=1